MIITSMAKSEEELNILLMKVKEESKKTEQGNALILQARLQQYMNWELPDIQAGLEKAEEPVIKLPTSAGS